MWKDERNCKLSSLLTIETQSYAQLLIILPLFFFPLESQNVEDPFDFIFEEKPQFRNLPAAARVDEMFKLIQSKLPGPPLFLLCILSERKNSDVYGKAF